jgi:hypothetical protein
VEYVFPITVPANTPKTSPVRVSMQLTAGTIVAVGVQFPPGPLGLVHVYVQKGLYQIWPSNTEADFSSDNETIRWAEDIAVSADAALLVGFGYSLDSNYSHTVTVRISLLPAAAGSDLSGQIAALLSGGE